MQRPPSPFALALSLFGVTLAATACSGGGGSGGGGSMQPGNPPPIVVTRSFPKGDAIGQGGGTAWDIIGVTTTLTGQFFGGNGNTYDAPRRRNVRSRRYERVTCPRATIEERVANWRRNWFR